MSEPSTTLNDVFKNTPLGNVKASIASTLYGLNHRGTPLPVPVNRDNHGYVFFTRPQLNFSTGNLRALRRFIPLLDQNALSLPRYIRRMLDPRLESAELPCALMDEKMAFIPIMTNHLLSCSGWPDPILDTFTSRPGAYREVYSLVDSVIENYSSYDLTCTFRNMQGDPITFLMDHWMWYMSKVFSGDLLPYPDFIALNEIDYQTRIWRLVMDKSKQFVQKIACSGVAKPTMNPAGNAFNFESDRPRNELNDQIQIRFQCTGFCYNDPILVHEFNSAVAIFNPDMYTMTQEGGATPQDMVKLQAGELQLFNNAGYPYIDPDTMELQWWVSTAEYQSRLTALERFAQTTGLAQA
jgi:hypothetical protein